MGGLASEGRFCWAGAQVRFFSQDELLELEGPCLVVYKDGSVAQGFIPQQDFRCALAAGRLAQAAGRRLVGGGQQRAARPATTEEGGAGAGAGKPARRGSGPLVQAAGSGLVGSGQQRPARPGRGAGAGDLRAADSSSQPVQRGQNVGRGGGAGKRGERCCAPSLA